MASMPISIQAPSRQINLEPLNPDTFAPFGSVIENPSHSRSKLKTTLQSISANQGSARRWLDVTAVTNFYSLAPSRKPGRLTVSMFVCSPRQLNSPSTTTNKVPIQAISNTHSTLGTELLLSSRQPIFPISILERHPYTSQTFIPLGLSKHSQSTHYLVIVAPTFPSPVSNQTSPSRPKPYQAPDLGSASSKPSLSREPANKGPPDLSAIRAFLANGRQAVTYGAGTWHAPMVVVGQEAIDFIVVQHVSGVPDEDCQEVVLESGESGDGLTVLVDSGEKVSAGSARARL